MFITIVVEVCIGAIVIILIMFQEQTVYFVLTAVPVAHHQHIVPAVTQLSLTICRQLIYVVALPINSLIPLTNAKIVVLIATLVLQVLVHALHASHLSLYQMAHASVQPILSFNILLLTEFGHTNAHRLFHVLLANTTTEQTFVLHVLQMQIALLVLLQLLSVLPAHQLLLLIKHWVLMVRVLVLQVNILLHQTHVQLVMQMQLPVQRQLVLLLHA